MAASKVKITFVPGDIAFWNRHFLPQYVRIVGKRQQSREDRLSGAPEYYTVQELDGKKRKYAKVADAELSKVSDNENDSGDDFVPVPEPPKKKARFAKYTEEETDGCLSENQLKNTVQNTSWGVGVFIGI